jgi:uncharacterized SAM-binding protein YcdF (DUF218 family)
MAVAIVVGAVLTERWFVHPRTDDPGTADAIFVLDGGGDRIGFTLELVRDGVATEVVFAAPFVASQGVWAARPCNSIRPENVPDAATFDCHTPEPGTTRGEARLLRDLATENGWETVVVVASTDQITRARRLISRCWDGEIRMTGPDHGTSWPIRALYEWGVGLKATLVRGC